MVYNKQFESILSSSTSDDTETPVEQRATPQEKGERSKMPVEGRATKREMEETEVDLEENAVDLEEKRSESKIGHHCVF